MVALCRNHPHKPPWVNSQLVTCQAGMMKATLHPLSASVQRQGAFAGHGQMEVGKCRKLIDDGRIKEGVHALNLLVQRGYHVPSNLFYRLLKRCIADKDLVLGRRIHALSVESGYEGDDFLATHLIGLYASHRRLEEAMQVFTKVSTPSAYTWASIIFAYARKGEGAQAVRLYRQMRQSTVKPDNRIHVAVLKACASAGDLVAGKEVHAHILASSGKPDIYVKTGLVDMYAKCGSLEDARSVFDGLSEKNMVTWNAMIAGYAQKGMGQEALNLYSSMQAEGRCSPNSVTFVCLLQACASIGIGALHEGEKLRAQIEQLGLQDDVVVGGSLVNMYAKCGNLEKARSLFDRLPDRSVVTWNAMLAGYAQKGMGQDALSLYSSMQQEGLSQPNSVTFLCILQACAGTGVGVLHDAKKLHAHIKEQGMEDDVVVGGSLVNMYAKCGSLEDARSVFDRLPVRNIIAWNAMLAGYAQQGMDQEALSLYSCMQQDGLSQPDRVTFVCLLQACASGGARALHQGRQLHAEIEERGVQNDPVLGCSLVNMYSKCGDLDDARSLFDTLPERDVVAWNAMLAGYAQKGLSQKALSLYSTMQQEGLSTPNSGTFVCLLQACAGVGVGALHEGKMLHAQIREQDLQDDVLVGGSLVNMYAKCGSLEDARTVFDRMPDRNTVTWNAILTGYAQQGMGQEALGLYSCMEQERSFSPDSVTFVCLLQACASTGVGALFEGKKLHAQIEELGLQDDVVVGGSLVNMYAKCGSLDDARTVFDRLPDKNMVTWNAMLAGYAHQGMKKEAFSLYDTMQEEGLFSPDSGTYVSLLQLCGTVSVEALLRGKQLHAQIIEQGLQDDGLVGCSLVNMYAKCGCLDDARSVFDSLPERDVVAWTVMIAGYAHMGMGEEALTLYRKMQQYGLSPPDSVTFVCLLQACATVGMVALHEGKQLHAQIKERGLEFDMVVGGSLVNMYAKCASLEDARTVFDRLPDRNMLTWNAMLAGYAQQGMGQEALTLYNSMQDEGLFSPDSVSFISLLQACASVGAGALHEGKQLHNQIQLLGLQDDVVLGGCLVNMYAKCGGLEDARNVFDRLPERDVMTWNAMLAGYAQQGMVQKALNLFRSMQEDGLCHPDSVTFVCLLQVCAIVACLPLGKQLHAQIEEQGMQADVVVGGALVNMYAKCGSMFDSQQVFDSLPERSVEAWGALIGGYTRHGDSEVVFGLLDRMRLEGIQPTGIIFLSVLTVCSHGGLVDKGRKYFEVMETDCGITPTVEHYTCMMDLLGRAGYLGEALQMTKTMPFPPDGAVWHTLLGACWKWNNVEIGQQAFEFAVRLDEKDAACYVLMSNIYAKAEMWVEAQEMQERRVKCGAWKEPGQSWWTDIGGAVHTFVAGDKTHPESEGIYARLEQLLPKLKKEGYMPHLNSSLRDISDYEKEAELCAHSEKLAIAYALNRTPEGTTIRVVKNLRVCGDCHTATAYISKVEKRTIICRDVSRFHVFQDGKCSCGDYW